MTLTNLKDLVILGVYMNYMQVCYLISGEYTIMTHCCLLINLSGIIIVAQRMVLGHAVHFLEKIGTAIALVGCVITLMDQ